MPKRPRIAVVGSANVDLTTFTDRFPKPGETIFGQKFDLGFGGKGANQAVASKLCGAEVFMVARVGSDLFGPATIQNFKKLGIDATYVKQVEGVSSGVAPIFVESSGQNRIFVVKGANDELKPADVDAAAEMLQTVDCMDYFVPNESEAETITGMPVRNLDDAKKCAAKLLGDGIGRVIITLGANGSLLASRDGMEHLPAFTVKSLDSTGAGDAFIGSFAVFLGEGLSEREAVRRANLYAGLSTTGVGTQKSFYDRARFDTEWMARNPTT